MPWTKAAEIFLKTGNLRDVQLLLGHSKQEIAARDPGIEAEHALSLSGQFEIQSPNRGTPAENSAAAGHQSGRITLPGQGQFCERMPIASGGRHVPK